MVKLNNLDETLKYGIDITRDLSTLTGNDDQRVPSYWVRTTDAFSTAITMKNVNEYNDTNHVNNKNYPGNITPEELRFPGIRAKILEIYEAEEDDLSLPFKIPQANGKIKINDKWIRINKEIDEDEFCKEDDKLILATRENRGYKIVVKEYSLNEIKQGKVNIELPISSIYRAATFVDSRLEIKKPRYPYAVLYFVLHLFKYSVPKDRISPRIQEIIDDLYDRKESLLEREKNKLGSTMDSVKNSMAPILEANRANFTGIATQLNEGLDSLNDSTIEGVADQCHKAIAMFTENSSKDLNEVISTMISADPNKVKDTMQNYGLSEENIRAIVKTTDGPMSNDELKSTLPDINDIDSFLK